MDTWALARNVRVKHLALYLVVAFVIDHFLAYTDGPLLLWDIGRAIEISIIVAFGWLIVRLFVEIRQG
jgi:hypothetical protein